MWGVSTTPCSFALWTTSRASKRAREGGGEEELASSLSSNSKNCEERGEGERGGRERGGREGEGERGGGGGGGREEGMN